jgi:hypothetical protein
MKGKQFSPSVFTGTGYRVVFNGRHGSGIAGGPSMPDLPIAPKKGLGGKYIDSVVSESSHPTKIILHVRSLGP